ncbi:hypothetical protein [Enterobacter mori]|uniref:hypothetical protein n=1 Tax=Enterobacter mori TaxID=539813 RepID=UPI001B8CDE5B|nr:hypothetical protein [Enterobacter mori]MBS3046395.1 hypothetical protein [Enterobacter mori]
MRILNTSEVHQVSGGAWWSTSSIMDFIRNITGSGTAEKIDWTSSNTVPSQGVGMGGIFGAAIVGVAAVIVGSVIAAASNSINK